MKKKELIKWLISHKCVKIREGKRHSWWMNPELNKRSSVPRHSEISNILAKKICKDLGIEIIK